MALPRMMTLIAITIPLILTALSLLSYSPTMTPTNPIKETDTATLQLQNKQLKAAISILINLETNIPSLENQDPDLINILEQLPFIGFTILAPPFPSIFDASSPTDLLCVRAHLVVGRLSYDQFMNNSQQFPRPRVYTLVPPVLPIDFGRPFYNDGRVRCSSPDLFLHPNLAVHGIDGLLSSGVKYCM